MTCDIDDRDRDILVIYSPIGLGICLTLILLLKFLPIHNHTTYRSIPLVWSMPGMTMIL